MNTRSHYFPNSTITNCQAIMTKGNQTMTTEFFQFNLNRSERRKLSSLLTLLPPVQKLLLFLVAIGIGGSSAHAQCYIDPLTGQQVCPRNGGGYRQVISQLPVADSN